MTYRVPDSPVPVSARYYEAEPVRSAGHRSWRPGTTVWVGAVVVAGLLSTGPGALGETPPVKKPGLPSHETPRLDLYGRFAAFRVYYRDLVGDDPELVRFVRITYVASDGRGRAALVILPYWYGPGHNPPLPLVISPHGRGVSEVANARYWGGLPAFGPFAVVCPEGQGRRLTLYSWGWKGQIRDLARMPRILAQALPWLRIDRRRIYALGSSMGGQETLMLVALYPEFLAGAAALDSDTNMVARYREFLVLRNGATLQQRARIEIGGTPATALNAYAQRSPLDWARAIAFSGVPLHIWWSTRDRIVIHQSAESGRLYREIKRLNPTAPVTQYVGSWAHSAEFRASARLPLALVHLRLITLSQKVPPP